MTSRSAASRASSGPAKWPVGQKALRMDHELAVAALRDDRLDRRGGVTG